MSKSLTASLALLAAWPSVPTVAAEPPVRQVVFAIHGGIARRKRN